MAEVEISTDSTDQVVSGIVDSDGHIFEVDEQLYPYFDHDKHAVRELKSYYLFPDLDGWRREAQGGRAYGHDANGWNRFLDDSKVTKTVLYPTVALGFGNIDNIEWAIDVARAYNDWVYDRFTRDNDRLEAIAVIPVQDPAAAAEELRRAVNELGLVGGMLPVPGLSRPYGDSAFDVLYEAAQSLGTVLAVHGAGYRGVGIDFPNATLSADRWGRSTSGRQGFRLAHPAQPFTQMVQFISMIDQGVFLRFPEMRTAFLEASCGWVPYWVERIDDKSGRPYAEEQILNSPVYFHTELRQTRGMKNFIDAFGDDRLIYATDWPHEPEDEVVELLEEFLHRDDVPLSTKEKILRDNTLALYAMK